MCVMMAPSIHLAACMVHACYNVNVLLCSVVEKCFVGMRFNHDNLCVSIHHVHHNTVGIPVVLRIH